MTNSWPYLQHSHYLLPVAPVTVFRRWSAGSSVTTGFLVDSGATWSVVPNGILLELAADAVDVVPVTGFDGVVAYKNRFEIDIEVLGKPFNCMRVLGTNGSIGMLGRDVLNDFVTPFTVRTNC